VKQIDRIQSSLLDVAAKKAGLTAAAHKILYGGYMGCGWKKWSDEVNIERMKMVLQVGPFLGGAANGTQPPTARQSRPARQIQQQNLLT
jgi:hypothetical protein